MRSPTQLEPSRTALVLVDFQEEFFSGGLPLKDAPSAVAHAQRLLTAARVGGLHVVHVHHVVDAGAPLFAAGSPGAQVRNEVVPALGEPVVVKRMAGGFSRTDLHARLQSLEVDSIIVAGLMTHLAVDTTVRDGSVLGYRVIVPKEASATRQLPGASGGRAIEAKALHEATLAALADRFADVLLTEQVVRLMRP